MGDTFDNESGDLLHVRFRRQALNDPTAIALTFGETQTTYGELLARADILARAFRARGLQPGDVVGVLGDRGPALVVAMLAVCGAGGVYLPLDSRYPDEQLAFALSDSGAKLTVCTPGLVDRPGLGDLGQVVVDVEGRLVEENAAEEQTAGTWDAGDGDRPLYIIYTSGSTGTPKGVLVTHRNVARLIDVTNPLFAFRPDDVWVFFHSFAFDFSVWELWGALLNGSRLVIVDYETSRDPWAFYRLVVKEKVTVLNQTPSAFAQFDRVDAAENGPLALRTVIFGGERLPMEALVGWWSRHEDTAPVLVNMYGITETTVHVTYRQLGRSDLGRTQSPIGTPLSDLSVSLRDPDGVEVAPGTVGEIYVAGGGVAQGYVNRRELTDQRFLEFDGKRWYRSGDLASWVDGELVIHGRCDDQVKIRGHRIELGQVEAVLSGAPGVSVARVVVGKSPGGGDQLVGYVVAGSAWSQASTRSYLANRLPGHMVPAVLVRCTDCR